MGSGIVAKRVLVFMVFGFLRGVFLWGSFRAGRGDAVNAQEKWIGDGGGMIVTAGCANIFPHFSYTVVVGQMNARIRHIIETKKRILDFSYDEKQVIPCSSSLPEDPAVVPDFP